jgi:DNA-damage-inducible protein D
VNDIITGSRTSVFERIKRTDSQGREFWSAREFCEALGYTEYRNFEPVIQKARLACETSGQRAEDHFVEVHEMVDIGSGAKREVTTTYLSRYACYLSIQNADPAKPMVSLGQTYFAIQTRRQELEDQSIEDERRLLLRREVKEHNNKLAGVAREAGVVKPVDFAIFQAHGYMGLYGGLNAADLHRKRRLGQRQHILDHMGSTELAANLFRATQTEEKIRREGIKGKDAANRTHRQVGAKVRQTIKELGGTMPEELPVAEDIRKVEAKKKKALKAATTLEDGEAE